MWVTRRVMLCRGPKTVQARFGTKAAPLAAAVDYAIAGDVAEVPVVGAQPGATSIRVIYQTSLRLAG
jgi:hypothetical protein